MSVHKSIEQKMLEKPKTNTISLIKNKSTLERLTSTLPKNYGSPERFQGLFLNVLRTNPKLARVANGTVGGQASFIGALLKCAMLGVEPGDGLNQVHLIPFKDEVQVILGYQGMIEIALRSGNVDMIMSGIVYKDEEFNYEINSDKGIVWNHNRKFSRRDPRNFWDEAAVVYAWGKLRNGSIICEPMGIDEVKYIREQTKKSNKPSPWDTWPDQMSRKTAIRRLYKSLPKSSTMAEAYSFTGEDETGEKQNLAHYAKQTAPELAGGVPDDGGNDESIIDTSFIPENSAEDIVAGIEQESEAPAQGPSQGASQ